MPSSDYGDRLTELGFKRITIFVRPDRADLVKATENALIADDLVDIALSINEDENGISDDRIDFFTGQTARGLPDTLDLDLEFAQLDPKSPRAKSLRAVYQMVLEAVTYKRALTVAAKQYEVAAPKDKFSAGLRYRLAFAKMYAHVRRAVTYHKLYLVTYAAEIAEEAEEAERA